MTIKNLGFIVCLLPTLALTVAVDQPSRSLDVSISPAQTRDLTSEVDAIFDASNAVRADKRRTSLQKDTKLMAAAQQYAELMATKDEMSHTIGGISLVDKAKRVGYAFRKLSENIAFNTELDGHFAVYEQWMKSKGHRENLLANDISQIGIGVAGPSKSKKYYYCQIFGAPLSSRPQ